MGVIVLAASPATLSASPPRHPVELTREHKLTRQQLIGAWRLVAIEVIGPAGVIEDPFYHSGSVGFILYDASGIMSVQISAPRRAPTGVAGSRAADGRATAETSPRAALPQAAAFDTYYAYAGMWSLADGDEVIHDVSVALIPDEVGHRYTQHVVLEGSRLTFIGADIIAGQAVTRRKIWERVSATR